MIFLLANRRPSRIPIIPELSGDPDQAGPDVRYIVFSLSRKEILKLCFKETEQSPQLRSRSNRALRIQKGAGRQNAQTLAANACGKELMFESTCLSSLLWRVFVKPQAGALAWSGGARE